jgi:hypothetical protein
MLCSIGEEGQFTASLIHCMTGYTVEYTTWIDALSHATSKTLINDRRAWLINITSPDPEPLDIIPLSTKRSKSAKDTPKPLTPHNMNRQTSESEQVPADDLAPVRNSSNSMMGNSTSTNSFDTFDLWLQQHPSILEKSILLLFVADLSATQSGHGAPSSASCFNTTRVVNEADGRQGKTGEFARRAFHIGLFKIIIQFGNSDIFRVEI